MILRFICTIVLIGKNRLMIVVFDVFFTSHDSHVRITFVVNDTRSIQTQTQSNSFEHVAITTTTATTMTTTLIKLLRIRCDHRLGLQIKTDEEI